MVSVIQMCFELTLVLMKAVCIVLEMVIDFRACYCLHVTLKMNKNYFSVGWEMLAAVFEWKAIVVNSHRVKHLKC